MNDSKMTPPPGDEPMSVRECRLILERLLVVAGTDPGALPACRDALLEAQVLGVPVLEAIHREPTLLTWHRPASSRGDDTWSIDGHGQYSLLLLPDLTDLLVSGVQHNGSAAVVVNDVRRPEHLQVLVPLLSARTVGVEIHSASSALTVRGTERDAGDRGVAQAWRSALVDGFRVPGSVWLDLYQRSNDALVSESPHTRRHAGHEDVDEHGNFIRQMDDDADIEHALQQRSTASQA